MSTQYVVSYALTLPTMTPAALPANSSVASSAIQKQCHPGSSRITACESIW
jgi:hypothetical protein